MCIRDRIYTFFWSGFPLILFEAGTVERERRKCIEICHLKNNWENVYERISLEYLYYLIDKSWGKRNKEMRIVWKIYFLFLQTKKRGNWFCHSLSHSCSCCSKDEQKPMFFTYAVQRTSRNPCFLLLLFKGRAETHVFLPMLFKGRAETHVFYLCCSKDEQKPMFFFS